MDFLTFFAPVNFLVHFINSPSPVTVAVSWYSSRSSNWISPLRYVPLARANILLHAGRFFSSFWSNLCTIYFLATCSTPVTFSHATKHATPSTRETHPNAMYQLHPLQIYFVTTHHRKDLTSVHRFLLQFFTPPDLARFILYAFISSSNPALFADLLRTAPYDDLKHFAYTALTFLPIESIVILSSTSLSRIHTTRTLDFSVY